MSTTRGHRAFQLYRRAREPDMCCAVPEDSEPPAVLDRNEWASAEILEAHQIRPPGFNESAAEYACAVQGFYFFRWSGKRRMATSEG